MFCKPHSGRGTAQFESLQEREGAEGEGTPDYTG